LRLKTSIKEFYDDDDEKLLDKHYTRVWSPAVANIDDYSHQHMN